METNEILKGKEQKLIKNDFNKLIKRMISEDGTFDESIALDTIKNITKLVPETDKIPFARWIIAEIVAECACNGLEMLGLLDLCKNDLIEIMKEND